MRTQPSPAVALALQAEQRIHPDLPPLELLDRVMQGRTGSVGDIADADRPGSELGQVLAACFDRGMTPEEWRGLTGPTANPAVVDKLLEVWHFTVLAGFAHRYGLTMPDGQRPAAPEVRRRVVSRRAF